MKQCFQSKNQTVYEHGESVYDHMFQLIEMLKTEKIIGDWKLPIWFWNYKKEILNNLLPLNIIKEYTFFHDCSKPYCKIIDESGKQHFPNHANLSAKIWLEVDGNEQVAKLMSMDMMIHQMKACDIDEFIKNPEAITLLLSGLAEIHANAELFNGIDSESFKIKYKQIEKRGNAICKKMFNGETK